MPRGRGQLRKLTVHTTTCNSTCYHTVRLNDKAYINDRFAIRQKSHKKIYSRKFKKEIKKNKGAIIFDHFLIVLIVYHYFLSCIIQGLHKTHEHYRLFMS